MKVALAQINTHIGNFDFNTKKVISYIKKAKEKKADIVVFPELAICGYPPQDLLLSRDFILKCDQAILEIGKYCEGIAAVIGTPVYKKTGNLFSLYNSACVIYNQKNIFTAYKTLLPNYDVFDEKRYFEKNKDFEIFSFKGVKIALTICEDIWNIQNSLAYSINPLDELYKQRPDFVINISASPFALNHITERKEIVRRNALKYSLPLFYVNHVGAHTEIIFDGGSMLVNSKGRVVKELKYFEEDMYVFDTKELEAHDLEDVQSKPNDNKDICNALILGVRDYFEKSGFVKALVGLSGGIDSALTLFIAVKALGKKNVKALLMPSEFSSVDSVNDAIALCKNLDVNYEKISINTLYDRFIEVLSPYFLQKSFDVTEENLQARVRGLILMALSNKLGYVLLNTTNKSEMAVGYGTLYGDMCGGISVLGDVYKTRVFEICKWINRDEELIPQNIIAKPPSAELRPGQKDSDSLPAYDILDEILFQYIECQKGSNQISAFGFDKELVNQVIGMVNRNEYKRYQAAPALRISSKAFGIGRRMPIVAKF